ncbi:hypothetical protein K8R30_04280 [archaeon]|nr:hypothetical protein [archaeon]
MKEENLLVPFQTFLRINLSPVPDITVFVNETFMLESNGTGDYNMSQMGAKKGIYSPNQILKGRLWSISGIDETLLLQKNE